MEEVEQVLLHLRGGPLEPGVALAREVVVVSGGVPGQVEEGSVGIVTFEILLKINFPPLHS